MDRLFASGRIVDVILLLVAVEAAALLVWRRRRGHGPSAPALLGNLASGASLMLAVRAALTGAHWTLVAGSLLAALLAHLADLGLRLRETSRRTSQSSEQGTSKETSAFTGEHQPGMISR